MLCYTCTQNKLILIFGEDREATKAAWMRTGTLNVDKKGDEDSFEDEA